MTNIVSDQGDRTALSKAKQDVVTFSQKWGYEPIELSRFKSKFHKLFFTESIIKKITRKMHAGDILLLQYPTYLGPRFENKLIHEIHEIGAKVVIIIHDLDSMRFDDTPQTLSSEIDELNAVDFVISDNSNMTDLLYTHGLKTKTSELEIFDYFHNEKIYDKEYSNDFINFAGNLNKSKFLFDKVNNFTLNLFGSWDSHGDVPENIIYNGSLPSNKLISKLNKGYGLVWDGESSQSMVGTGGLYLKYNNPHKTSLYLSSGLPVIIWSDAALAKFVKINNVGITVDSLSDVSEKIKQITQVDYDIMAHNAKRISQKLTNGYFLKRSLEKSEDYILNQK